MIASREMIPSPIRRRALAGILVAAASIAAAPRSVSAAPEVVAARGIPSSISSEYGTAVPLGDPSVAGSYVIPTRTGIEIRDAVLGADAPIGSFRVAGVVDAVAVDGSTAYLFTGSRGIVAVDVSTPANPVAIGSHGDLGDVTLGAASPNGYGLVAAAGSTLHFLARSTPGTMSLLTSLQFADGRLAQSIIARADSFLVVSAGLSPTPRLLLTLYRLPFGDTQPESLLEIPVLNQTPTGLAWRGDLAFIAAGNLGVLVANVRTGTLSAPLSLGRFVRAVDANDSVVVAVAQAGTFARIRRAGVQGDSLVNPTLESLPLEPLHVSLQGSRVLIPSDDVAGAQEPDETGRSAVIIRDLESPISLGPLGGTGRTRRAAWDAGYAYVADYTGGLRVYRADDSDTSLVGVLALGSGFRVADIALDKIQNRVFLASGSQGLQVVDISDPTTPSLLSTFLLPGLASAVAVIDTGRVVVGRRDFGAGLSFIDVSVPTSPSLIGQTLPGLVEDPRAIAVRDTVAFVADASRGLLSVGFQNAATPGLIGTFSGVPGRDLDLSGNTLLFATDSEGLQIVDVSNPAVPGIRSRLATPPIVGMARSGGSAVLLLGAAGALVADVTNPDAPMIRGPIGVPGITRDAVWVGDTLLVTTGLALERFRVSPAVSTVAALTIDFEGGLLELRATISWGAVSLPGILGVNLYRDVIATPPGTLDPVGERVNSALLSPLATGIVDSSLTVGITYQYRLEAFFSDGSSLKIAEGSIAVPSAPVFGRPYPNPYRPADGVLATLPFKISTGAPAGGIEMSIFNASGRLVRRVILPAPVAGGFGIAAWDGRNARGQKVPAGVYFWLLRGQGIDDSHQLIVVH